jgi:hypothetical protein
MLRLENGATLVEFRAVILKAGNGGVVGVDVVVLEVVVEDVEVVVELVFVVEEVVLVAVIEEVVEVVDGCLPQAVNKPVDTTKKISSTFSRAFTVLEGFMFIPPVSYRLILSDYLNVCQTIFTWAEAGLYNILNLNFGIICRKEHLKKSIL